MDWGRQARGRPPRPDAHGSCGLHVPLLPCQALGQTGPSLHTRHSRAFSTPARERQAPPIGMPRQRLAVVSSLESRAWAHIQGPGHPVLAGPLRQWPLQGATQTRSMTQRLTPRCPEHQPRLASPLKPPSKESPSVDKRRLNRRQPPSPGRVVCAFSDRKTASPVCNQVTSQGSSWSLTSSRIPSSLCDKPLPLPGVPPKVQLGIPWQAKPGSPRFSAHPSILNKDLRIKGQCGQGLRPVSAQAWPGPHGHTYSYTYILPQVGPTTLCSGGAPPRKASSSASPSSSS